MTNLRKNKLFVRIILMAGTLLAGLAIFSVVSHAAMPASSNTINAVTTSLNSNFSTADTFLTQSPPQQGITSGQPLNSSLTIPARTSRLRTRGS